jgi:hypothetical protein
MDNQINSITQREVNINIKFDENNGTQMLQSLFLNVLSLWTNLEQLLNDREVHIDGKPLMRHQFKQKTKAYMAELERVMFLYEGYHDDECPHAIETAVKNFTQLFQILSVISPEAKSVCGVVAALYQSDRAKFNTLTANLIQTPIKL